MEIQVRLGMNYLDTGKGEVSLSGYEEMIWGPFASDPVIDYRDSLTVWVWLGDDLCVELDRYLVESLLEGFKEQPDVEE